MNFLRSLLPGFFVFALQLGLALALAPGKSEGLGPAWKRLLQWDSQHYLSIAREGYRLPPGTRLEEVSAQDVHQDRANGGFFPAYPLLSRALARGTGLSHEVSLLVVSQLCCWLFWSLLIAWLTERGVAARDRLWVAYAVALHPASFFLVAGYTESLFMAGLLGLLYWDGTGAGSGAAVRAGAPRTLAAAVSGFALTATRIVGLPLAGLPMLRAVLEKGGWVRGALLSAASACGGLAFFAWSRGEFGHWDAYIRLQQKGWANHPDYLAILNPLSYVPRFFFENTVTSISRASIPFIVGLFGWTLAQDVRRGPLAWRRRAGLYFAAFVTFYISLSGKANADMDSMIRYSFPPFALLCLCLAETGWLNRARFSNAWFRAGAIVSLLTQLYMLFLFTRGKWVA